MDWHGFLFGAQQLPLPLIMLRAVLLYTATVVATRVLRFRHIGILAKHNYLVAAAVVGVAGAGIINSRYPLVLGLLSIASLTLIGMGLSYLDLKLPQYLRNNPIPLISYGKMNKKQLRKASMTIDNLLGQLRLNGVFDLNNVDSAYFESTGKVSVFKKPESQPVLRQQMGLPHKNASPPAQLVYDGEIMEENLHKLGLDKKWLETELQKQGFASHKNVFLAALLADGTLYVCSL
ncbi:MAG: DUF421 domain-containing protein [Desulfotomaculum sp.]|nr:DUF421 domain-containing protein [Desulfotomaculum sp.]